MPLHKYINILKECQKSLNKSEVLAQDVMNHGSWCRSMFLLCVLNLFVKPKWGQYFLSEAIISYVSRFLVAGFKEMLEMPQVSSNHLALTILYPLEIKSYFGKYLTRCTAFCFPGKKIIKYLILS